MAKRDDLTWLVKERSRVQELLLRLYNFGNRPGGRLLGQRQDAFELLVGAAFSLWRAAFLVEPKTTPRRRLKQARDFLRKLVSDNTIGYSQDKATQSWTAGYYLNNAYSRLSEAVTLLRPRLPKGFRSGRHERACQLFQQENRRNIVSRDRRRAWEIAYDAACAAEAVLERVLQKSPHGARRPASNERLQPTKLRAAAESRTVGREERRK